MNDGERRQKERDALSLPATLWEGETQTANKANDSKSYFRFVCVEECDSVFTRVYAFLTLCWCFTGLGCVFYHLCVCLNMFEYSNLVNEGC